VINIAADLVFAVFEIFGVGQNVVDARRVVLAELEAAVDDDDVVAKLDAVMLRPISSTPPSGMMRMLPASSGGIGFSSPLPLPLLFADLARRAGSGAGAGRRGGRRRLATACAVAASAWAAAARLARPDL
jgi:hypothetical protein